MPVVVEEPDDLVGSPSRKVTATIQSNGGGGGGPPPPPNLLAVDGSGSSGGGGPKSPSHAYRKPSSDDEDGEDGLGDSERLDESGRYVRGGGILASKRDVDVAPTEFAEGKGGVLSLSLCLDVCVFIVLLLLA